MGPMVLKFGLDPRLSTVSTSLRRVRAADGDIQGSVGVAQGRGEDVCGPQVRARMRPGTSISAYDRTAVLLRAGGTRRRCVPA